MDDAVWTKKPGRETVEWLDIFIMPYDPTEDICS